MTVTERCSRVSRRWRQRWVRERARAASRQCSCDGWSRESSELWEFLRFSIPAARRAVALERCAAAANTYPRKLPVLARLAVQTLCCLCVLVCEASPLAAAKGSLRPQRRVPTTASQQPTAERDHPLTRGFSGILSLELCVRLLRCCVSALISAVCSTTLSCTADPVAGADLLRCSQLQGEHSRS